MTKIIVAYWAAGIILILIASGRKMTQYIEEYGVLEVAFYALIAAFLTPAFSYTAL